MKKTIPAEEAMLQFLLLAIQRGRIESTLTTFSKAFSLRRQLYRYRKQLKDNPSLSGLVDLDRIGQLGFSIKFGKDIGQPQPETRVVGNGQTFPVDSNTPAILVVNFNEDVAEILGIDTANPVLPPGWEAEETDKDLAAIQAQVDEKKE